MSRVWVVHSSSTMTWADSVYFMINTVGATIGNTITVSGGGGDDILCIEAHQLDFQGSIGFHKDRPFRKLNF